MCFETLFSHFLSNKHHVKTSAIFAILAFVHLVSMERTPEAYNACCVSVVKRNSEKADMTLLVH
jgi:hypothetical protein